MRVVPRRAGLPVLVAAVACSVSGPDPEPNPLAGLAEARQRWIASGISDYDLRMRRSCGECLPTSALHVVVSVSGGVKTVSLAETGVEVLALPQTYPDVDGLFDLIEQMALAGAAVEVEYDGARGFPRVVSVDPVPGAVDDEFGFVIEELIPGPHTALRAELAVQREKWSAKRIESYQLTLRRSCFCGPGAAGLVVVNVFEREPVEWLYFLSGEPVEAGLHPVFPGVDGLFDFVEEAIRRGAESIEVDFDPDLGLPLEIRVDFRLAAADEEIAYGVEKILPIDDGVDPTPARAAGR